MNRRQFAKTLGLGALSLGMSKTVLPHADETPRLAITIDDFNFFCASQAVAEKRNRALLDVLTAHSNLKAAAFICGRNIDSDMGRSLVNDWAKEGHTIANH